MVDKTNEPSGKGRATPSRKEAEAARKKQMKTPVTRRKQLIKEREIRNAQRSKARDAMKSGGDDKNLPLRERGPVRRFSRDFVDRRFNLAEFLLPLLIIILLFSFVNQPWAQRAVFVLWSATIVATVVDEVVLVRGLKKELRERFEPGDRRGAVPYAVLRTTQLRRFRLPKPQVKRGAQLRSHY